MRQQQLMISDDVEHADLAVRIPTTPANAATVRQVVLSWASTHELSADQVNDVVLASYEAVANAVEHAYRDRPGDVELRGRRLDGMIEITIRDFGHWRPAHNSRVRGRGIALMHALADAVVVRPGAQRGTLVTLAWHTPTRDRSRC